MKSVWLTHHAGEVGLARCIRVAGIWLCARCSGLWPSLLGTMLLETFFPIHLPETFVLPAEVLLLIPSLWDVIAGAIDPASGTNRSRLLSGAGLGVVLGHAAAVGHRDGFAASDVLLPLLLASATSLFVLKMALEPPVQMTDAPSSHRGAD